MNSPVETQRNAALATATSEQVSGHAELTAPDIDLAENQVEVDSRPVRQRGGRAMQKGRFLLGLMLSAVGIVTMLLVALGMFRVMGIEGQLSLPVVAVCMIIGLMLLGGGFGIMATASPTFDDDEFERLMNESCSDENTDPKDLTLSSIPQAYQSHEKSRRPDTPVVQQS